MKQTLAILFFTGIFFCQSRVMGQSSTSGMRALPGKVIDEDTVLVANLPEVNVYPSYQYKNRWDYWRYRRLVRNVKIAYPYAKLAASKLKEIDNKLVSVKNEKKRKELIKIYEKSLMDDFEDEIRHLTITQGRILLKLIDRETGNTTYYILQDLKGKFSAVFWQTIARVFGSNLKSEYDPVNEDKLIEQIVLMIDTGQL